MRDYAKIVPSFWTKGSGRALRGNPDAQVVALYLFTCPSSNMIGLYYLPVPTLQHETGLPEKRCNAALSNVCAAGIASYDREAELVWVPEMARYQIGDRLTAGDKRIKGFEAEALKYQHHKFFDLLHDRYFGPFALTFLKPLRSPLQAPSKGLRSQDQDQDQDQDQEHVSDGGTAKPAPESAKSETSDQIAWRLWRKSYATSRRGYGTYAKSDGDGKAMQRLAAHAVATCNEHGHTEELETLLSHWFKSFLRDEGFQNCVTNARHPLRMLDKYIPTYGLPWKEVTKPRSAQATPNRKPPEQPLVSTEEIAANRAAFASAISKIGRGPVSKPGQSLTERQELLRAQADELLSEEKRSGSTGLREELEAGGDGGDPSETDVCPAD